MILMVLHVPISVQKKMMVLGQFHWPSKLFTWHVAPPVRELEEMSPDSTPEPPKTLRATPIACKDQDWHQRQYEVNVTHVVNGRFLQEVCGIVMMQLCAVSNSA
mmetsp:Transcript_36601/g.66358  ORF Transcript_36601/g.66358 Transcript_36601/m.66358 type:complete len:104 (-) Transcript_36601:974-1285(-)